MKVKLLIGTNDIDYVKHLSNVLSEKYADIFDVSVCSSLERLKDLLHDKRIDILLMEPNFVSAVDFDLVQMPFILFDGSMAVPDCSKHIKKIHKYQKISSTVGDILENYAGISENIAGLKSDKANIVAVWSPHGGVGKTTVALAYAARKAAIGKSVVYLNLENFSSVGTYFLDKGKSISTIFDKFDSNLTMLLKGIRMTDSGSGISYFCGPENYDDMNILSVDDIKILVAACSVGTDELIVDLSSQCDEKVRKIFELANTIFVVVDSTATSSIKLNQFINQSNIFQIIQKKSVLINNKNARNIEESMDKIIYLPLVKATDPISIYKTLSGNKFDW